MKSKILSIVIIFLMLICIILPYFGIQKLKYELKESKYKLDSVIRVSDSLQEKCDKFNKSENNWIKYRMEDVNKIDSLEYIIHKIRK